MNLLSKKACILGIGIGVFEGSILKYIRAARKFNGSCVLRLFRSSLPTLPTFCSVPLLEIGT